MPINITQLKQLQMEYASQIILKDDVNVNMPKFIGGADVGFESKGSITRAAIVILSFPSLELIEYKIARIETTIPYIPGYLSFREYPALSQAWKLIEQKPDLLFVDGQGVAHPRKLGVASHVGLLFDVPTIGVAKSKLCGEYEPLKTALFSHEVLNDKLTQQQIGWVLQSKLRCKPLFVSAGHRISQHSALQWVINCLNGYRLPEPTRFADAVASNKSLFKKWLMVSKHE